MLKHFPSPALCLQGGGARPEECRLVAPPGADAALDVRATAKLCNLAIQASAAPCILHKRGQLAVEACALRCSATSLSHLVAPIVTLASVGVSRRAASPAPAAAGEPAAAAAAIVCVGARGMESAAAGAAAARDGRQMPVLATGGDSGEQPCSVAACAVLHPLHGAASVCPPVCAGSAPAAPLCAEPRAVRQARLWQGVGCGRLAVVETLIEGGGGARAVHCRGTGELRDVRIVQLSRTNLFWFAVDAALPGVPAAADGCGGASGGGEASVASQAGKQGGGVSAAPSRAVGGASAPAGALLQAADSGASRITRALGHLLPQLLLRTKRAGLLPLPLPAAALEETGVAAAMSAAGSDRAAKRSRTS